MAHVGASTRQADARGELTQAHVGALQRARDAEVAGQRQHCAGRGAACPIWLAAGLEGELHL